ncbi:unnamed protein product, partial [marine sediment metagenome]
AGGDMGSLLGWYLELTLGDIVTQSDAFGQYEFRNLPPGPMEIRQELTHQRRPTNPSPMVDTIIEDFESGIGNYVQVESGQTSALSALAAYSGSQGLSAGGWIHGNASAPKVHAGDTITGYIRFSDNSGELAHLGFGADGSRTLACAVFTGVPGSSPGWLEIQELVSYDPGGTWPWDEPMQYTLARFEFDDVLLPNPWYRLEVDWGQDNSIVARLYEPNGTKVGQLAAHVPWQLDEGTLAFRGRLTPADDEVWFDRISVRRDGHHPV